MKLFHKIHLWLALPFGVFIALICFSGAMLVFEDEVTDYLQRDIRHVAVTAPAPLPIEDLEEKVWYELPDDVEITRTESYDEPTLAYRFGLSRPRHGGVFVNPYTGEITGYDERPAFFMTMFKLHRWLLDSANPRGEGFKLGKTIVGISTIAFAITLLTGLALWIPRVRKKSQQYLSIPLKQGAVKFWKRLHVVGGVYAMIFLLTMALTGLTWSFGWYREAFYSLFGDADGLHRLIREIHTGAFGGMTTKIIWFISALIGTSLPITGYWIYIRHLIKRRHKV